MQRLLVLLVITVTLASLPVAAIADSGTPYLINPIKCPDFLCLAIQIIRFLLAGVAVFSTAMFIYGGYLFLTSAGNAEQVKKGKETLLWASLGIFVILTSWVVLQYVFRGLTNASF